MTVRMRAFSLETDPFADDINRRFYFDTPALSAQQDDLCRHIENGDVLIVDVAGSGKSTALERFAETAGEQVRVFFVRAHVSDDARDLSNAVVAALGLPLREPVAAELRDADAFLELVCGRGQRAVIVIDDAHRLRRGALEQLLYLLKRWQRYDVSFLIAAEPELCDRLEDLDSAHHLLARTVRLSMPRFDWEEIGDYLNLCLFRAGLSGNSPFDAERVSRVAARARGLVGAVGPAARELLDECMRAGARPAERARPSARRWPLALAAAAALAVLGTVAFPWKVSTGAASMASPMEGGVPTDAAAAGFRSSIAPRRRHAGDDARSAARASLDTP